MDVRQLEMFKAVAEFGGFTNAARHLYVSHSAISRQIKLLEDELQAMLFVRKGRNVSLTTPGKALLGYADGVLQQITEAKRAVSASTQEQQGPLHIGTATNILEFFLLPVLESLRRSFPKVSILTTTGNADRIIEEIRSGTINVGVVSLPIDAHGLTLTPLYQEEFGVVVPSRSALGRRKTKSLTIEELQGLPIITYPQGSALRRILDSLFAQRGIVPNIRLEVENEEAVEQAVAHNRGISFLSQRRAQTADRIRFLRISGHRIYRDVAIVRAPLVGNVPKYVAHFERVCREHLRSFDHNRFIRPLADA
jgi:DNA-binding transcriptional LysR family regulator